MCPKYDLDRADIQRLCSRTAVEVIYHVPLFWLVGVYVRWLSNIWQSSLGSVVPGYVASKPGSLAFLDFCDVANILEEIKFSA